MNKIRNIPQGYKATSLGIIPQEWEIKKLGDIANIFSGTTPSRNNILFFKEGIIPWVKTTDLNNGNLTNTEEKITEFALKSTTLRIFPKGTILIAMYGGFNQIGRVAILCIEATINQALSALVINKAIITGQFLLNWLLLRVNYWKRYAASSRKDPNITKADVLKFPILVPSLAEQQKIAKILGTWDKAIEKQSRLIEKLELRKKGLMQQLLTGKRRLPGFSDSWKKVKLGDICSIKKGKTLSSSQVKDGIYPVIAGGKTIPYFHNEYTDQNVITISASGAYAGYVSLHENKIWASDCSVISTSGKNSILRFIYALLSHKQSYIYSLQIGGAQPHVFPKDIAKINLCVPTKEEQIAIAEVLTAAGREIELAQQKLEQLRQQKHGLMQQLLTGKKRVNINN